MSEYRAAVEEIAEAICQRYNVPSLDGLGALEGAVQQAQNGNIAPLEAALEGREMYRWGPVIGEALARARKTSSAAPPGDAESAEDGAEPPRRTRKRTEKE